MKRESISIRWILYSISSVVIRKCIIYPKLNLILDIIIYDISIESLHGTEHSNALS